MQAEIKALELKLMEAINSKEAKSVVGSESGPAVSSIPKSTGDVMDSSAVSKKLEEELVKRDALIEVCYSLQFNVLTYYCSNGCLIMVTGFAQSLLQIFVI